MEKLDDMINVFNHVVELIVKVFFKCFHLFIFSKNQQRRILKDKGFLSIIYSFCTALLHSETQNTHVLNILD